MSDDKMSLGKALCIAATQDAIKVRLLVGGTRWVPQSCIDDDSEVWRLDDEGNLVVALWWAAKEGLA